MGTNIGLKLQLQGGRTLTLGEADVVLFDPASKKANRSSCSPITGDLSGKRSISLYNVLWAEFANDTITIDFATQSSKKAPLNLQKLSYPVAAKETSSDDASPDEFVAALLARAYVGSQQRRRAYVLVNPSSGPGHAVRKWKTEAKPLFDAARAVTDVVVLSRGGEATDLVEKMDIDKYDTIVSCSGDGTPYEIFNGLGKRPDAKRALSEVAVSHLPCGSGNALCLNLAGTHNVSLAALAIIKGVVTPMDLVSVTQGDRRILSFLSQTLGIVAEADLGTENMRWMGGTRFTVGLLMRVSQRKCYPYELSVKVEADTKEEVKALYARHARDATLGKPSEIEKDADGAGLPKLKYGTVQDKVPADWHTASYDKVGNFYCGNMPYMAADAKFFNAARPSDGCMDLITVNGDLGPITATRTLMAVETDKFFDNANVTYKKVSAYRITPRQESGYISIDGEKIPFEPFQAEIHQGLGRVISKSGGYEGNTGPTGWEKVSLA